MREDGIGGLPRREIPLDRHRAFWTRGKGSLLRSVAEGKSWRKRAYPLSGGRLADDPVRVDPSDLDLDRSIGPIDELPPGSDLAPLVAYRYPAAWMEAIIGCPVFASAYGFVSKPAVARDSSVSFDPLQARQSPWREILGEAVRRSVRIGTEEDLPVCQPHLRGIVDMVAAYLGEERFCFLVMDDPSALRGLAARFSELWIGIAGEMLRLRPAWRGGYASTWKLWAPGPLIDYQIDASSLLSPAQYRDIFLPFDREILSSFPFSLVHLHSVGLHVLPAMLSTRMTTVEISPDREAGPWREERIFGACRSVQDADKSLIYVGELDAKEEEALMDGMSPRGVALDLWRVSRLPG